MSNAESVVNEQKEKLLLKIKKIQTKIDALENQRADKIQKLAKKFKLLDLDDAIIEKEFLLIREKYAAYSEKGGSDSDIKKN